MQSDIRLFIGGKEAYFSSDPKILFNCKETELRNPTIVKNTWTKSVSLPSCQANNDIFNQFWKLDRVQGGGTFNAMLKTPFELYLNGSLIQNGYCKLDSVKISNGNSEYQVTLFGGLGDFFYNLSYFENGNTNTKKSLASLNYADGYDDIWGEEPNLDITINKETVSEAWDALLGGGSVTPDDKWDVINFAPCYNGIPKDFDADKAIVNYVNLDRKYFINSSSGDGETADYFQPILNGAMNKSGYTLAELREALTCDETFDFRSYLQRPVVNVYRTILACCNPANNGGYQVKLDPHFFHYENPYYYGHNAWMTLPMLRDLGVEGGHQEGISGATVTDAGKNVKVVNYSAPTLSQINNIRMRVNVGLSTDATGNTLYTYFNYHSNAATLNTNIVRDMKMNEGVCVMLVGRDNTGKIAAQSTESYCLSSYQFDPVTWKNINEGFSVAGYPAPRGMRFVYGMWKKISGQWVFTDLMGRQVDLEFTFNNTFSLSSLELIVQIKGGESVVKKILGRKDWQEYPDEATLTLWKSQGATDNENRLASGVKSAYGYTGVTPVFNITEFSAIATDYEALFSNSFISREKILSTSFTPAEFLISYCKLFGLYFYRDPAEVADNETLFPKGVIHIMDRDSFYTGEYVDLEDRIDHSRDMSITPAMAASKWYSFDLDPVESEAQKAYQTTYGYNYGRQLVNTGYNFDEGTTNLYDGNVFKGGVMVREKDKYFCYNYKKNPRENYWIPSTAFNGLKNTLFHPSSGEFETFEYEVPYIGFKGGSINTLGLKNYDAMPKLQCHSEDNEAVEGDGVLLFYVGGCDTGRAYWLTDDLMEMVTLNDGNACWIMTMSEYNGAGNQIAIRRTNIPRFSRDYIHNLAQEGNIVHSWNFGHPQVTFSPNTYTTEGDSIYDKCWKDYIGDLYSVDTKKLTCYVKLDGRPSNEWLRKWYFFDNSVWRLNEIKDWNICGLDTVQCEFIKVRDVDNYHLEEIRTEGFEAISVEPETVPYSGGIVTVTIRQQGGGWWYMDDNMIPGTDTQGNNFTLYGAASKTSGSGNTDTFTITFPQSPSGYPITWRIGVEDENDNWLWTSVLQEGQGDVPYIRIVETGVTVPATGGTSAVTYEYHNIITSSITFSFDQSWVTGSMDTTAKTITFTAQGNEGAVTRTANIGISGRDETHHVLYSDTCEITQPAYGGFALEGSPITFNYDEDVWTDKAILKVVADSGTTWTITDFNDV